MDPRRRRADLKISITYEETESGRRVREVMVADSPATSLGRMLLELQRVCVQIDRLLRLFPPESQKPGATTETDRTEALRFLLDQYLIVKACCFIDRIGQLEGLIREQPGGLDILQWLSPVKNTLKRNGERFKDYRNALIAHAQGKADIAHPYQRILEGGFPTHYAESHYMGGLCILMMARLQSVYEKEIADAEFESGFIGKHLASFIEDHLRRSPVKTSEENRRAIEEMIALVPPYPEARTCRTHRSE
jgi:hypothetical protein